jgi:hypothetical protein
MLCFLNEPELYWAIVNHGSTAIGDGIFNVDGEIWHRHRKTSSKLFSLNVFKGTVMYQCELC